MRGTLTQLRRDVLNRLAARGPLARDEANAGRKNSIPGLIRLGWVRSRYGLRPHVVYEITESGRLLIGDRAPTTPQETET
jgi:hypothetical protein